MFEMDSYYHRQELADKIHREVSDVIERRLADQNKLTAHSAPLQSDFKGMYTTCTEFTDM